MSNSSATPPRRLSAKRSSADFFSREPSRPRRFSTEMLKTLWIRWERRGVSSGQGKRSSALHQKAAPAPASKIFAEEAPPLERLWSEDCLARENRRLQNHFLGGLSLISRSCLGPSRVWYSP